MRDSLRAKGRSIPTIGLSGIAACLLASCGDPYADQQLKPAGYYGALQILEEQATGCLYTANTKTSSEPKPLRRPDGSQMGCRNPTPAVSQAHGGNAAAEPRSLLKNPHTEKETG